MENQLIQFDIIGLHGVCDYSIKMENGKVIIVGENGSGKTTVFKIMYHTLACDWDSLRTFSFESVKMYFSNQTTIQVDSELLQSIFAINDIERVAYYVDGRPRNRRMHFDGLINNLIAIKRKTEDKNADELERLYVSSPFPYQYKAEIRI